MSVNVFLNGALKRVAGNVKDITSFITNHLNATEAGTALDAVQGKVLNDKIKELVSQVEDNSIDIDTLSSSLQSEIDTKVGKADVLTTMEELDANTNADAVAGASVVKEVADSVAEVNEKVDTVNESLGDIIPSDSFIPITLPYTATKSGNITITHINHPNGDWYMYININDVTLNKSGYGNSLDSYVFPCKKGDVISISETNATDYNAYFR